MTFWLEAEVACLPPRPTPTPSSSPASQAVGPRSPRRRWLRAAPKVKSRGAQHPHVIPRQPARTQATIVTSFLLRTTTSIWCCHSRPRARPRPLPLPRRLDQCGAPASSRNPALFFHNVPFVLHQLPGLLLQMPWVYHQGAGWRRLQLLAHRIAVRHQFQTEALAARSKLHYCHLMNGRALVSESRVQPHPESNSHRQ